MLSELKVSQFAIIDELNIHFENGFNIISGETGAGKSIILKCLSLLMGQKTSVNIIQQGKNSATVIGAFDLSSRSDVIHKLDELGIFSDDDSLIVRRVINSNGKSKVYINDSLTTLTTLKNVVSPLIEFTNQNAPLIEMTAQHENKNLQSIDYQLDLLDSFTNCWDLRNNYLGEYTNYKDVTDKIEQLESQRPDHEQRIDFLKYQLNEIENLGLQPGDEEGLEEQIKILKNSHQLLNYLNETETALYSSEKSCLVVLHNLIQKAQSFSDVSKTLLEKLEPLKQAKTLIEETLYDIRDYANQVSVNPEELLSLEDSLNSLRKLQRKYGKSIADIFKQKNEIEQEIAHIENFDEHLNQLYQEKETVFKTVQNLASQLHQERIKGAKKFTKKINDELLDLNMKGVCLNIVVTDIDKYNLTGASSVQFMIKQNKKDQERPIAKIASGGELSRILLSIKKVIGSKDVPRTFLFDEVDTGVSGPTAEKVGRKLKDISKGQQVICVTHLPQVAAFADQHFLIEKKNQQNKTDLVMKKLTTKDKVQEIARLISGEKITKTSLAHAKELLSI